MSTLQLIKPNSKFQASYLTYIQELGEEERYPFPLDFDHNDFSAMLCKINDFEQGLNLPEGYVPSSTYWLVQGNELIGVSNLRHKLNEQLKTAGGHIGLEIRPNYRGNRLGIQLLEMTIEKAKKRGINPVHIHCYRDNTASVKMIVACGGVLDSAVVVGAESVQKFLIKW